MSLNNIRKFIKDSSTHIININRVLKNIKSNVIVDFICIEDKGIVISTNNVVSLLDLQEIEGYIKNFLSSNNVEKIMKSNHIFNDIILASKPRIIKVSPKSDMSII